MNLDKNSLRDFFLTIKKSLSSTNNLNTHENDVLPLRAELFSALQMEQHGRILANSHKLSNGWARDQLLSRLANNESIIIETCNQMTEVVKIGRQVTPAAEWLLDNFYLIEEQIRTAKRHLPKNYSKELPRLSNGHSAGRPRAYDIALEIISHGDGRIDPEGLSSYVAAYQQISVLKLGELWAIPIMLRLALIENLRRVSVRLSNAKTSRNLACSWAENMILTAEKDPNNLILLVADMARSNPPMDSSFISELVRRLQGQSTALMLPLNWISQRLSETGQTIEHLVQSESQQQAADQVSISNSIGSLRFLSSMDWRDFVENMSSVEHILRKDPAKIYDKMDFSTRDHYRHIIENIAKNSNLSESEVAENALRFSNIDNKNKEVSHSTDDRTSHVGYYIIGNGVNELERSAEFQLPLIEVLKRYCANSPLSIYFSGILLLTLLSTSVIVIKAYRDGVNIFVFALITLFALLATSQLALAMVNWLATLLTAPRLLPRMDFSKGIPLDSSSLVVVPTLLFNKANVDKLTEALEVRFLANHVANLRFCLLTDFADAASETLTSDMHLLYFAKNNIDELNAKYRDPDSTFDQFILLHRPRLWNEQEKSWMGYERKRGKLADLNAFLRGGAKDAFSLIVGNTDGMENIRYVITLDTDTELPRDAARKFVAAMAHPLNRARYDEKLQRVCEGYGILQPRVAVSLPSANASRYELLFGGEIGIDPYTRSVSDVYQDVFGEGSFIGKGIYEVDTFELALKGRLPDNRILSHDLLEGCYARAGLLSDVQLHEQHPSSYAADVSRRHRWIRGDWQIASWLFPSVPGDCNSNSKKITRCHNPLSALSRWKLFDNLRRSIVPIALTAFLLTGWIALPSSWFWSVSALTIIFLPAVSSFIFHLFRKQSDVLLRQHLSGIMRSTNQHLMQATLTLTFLPYEAWSNLDAIFKTHWRILFSRMHLLEWKPSSETNRQSGNGLSSYIRQMWIAPSIAIATAIYLAFDKIMALPAAVPILFLWIASPFIANWISNPITRRLTQLNEEQKSFLTSLSRKTWSFFETYVTEEDNWLPPDNVQEYPVAVVARRTSPTNIGLSLLANLAAYDFAYITAGKMIGRTKNTFQSMEKLERFQGHFYNWYDTQHLTPLNPIYVSTVDSGNLAGHLLTLRVGLIKLADAPIFSLRVFHGIRETYEILLSTADSDLKKKLDLFDKNLAIACLSPPENLIVAHDFLVRLSQGASNFFDDLDASSESQLHRWAGALSEQCLDALNELNTLAPWVNMLVPDKWVNDFSRLINIPSLHQLAKLELSMVASFEKKINEKNVDHQTSPTESDSIQTICQLVADGSARANERLHMIEQLAKNCTEYATMAYGFLYDSTTHLLAIGYNVTERRRDTSYYDLLASEARLTTFIAIAQGQLPQESWFALGRQLTLAGGEPILMSWSGSMFEYLMPLLVMPSFDNTLLDQTYHSAVQRQIEYGEQRSIPWGISESGYNAFDASLNYQYRAFGVPGLGFKRGLGNDLVVAPYACMMALMVAPEQACKNLQNMAKLGFEGKFGFYEAIDYTQSRLPRGQSNTIIRSFMTHHQGMGFLSLAYLLLERPMQKRFESDPMLQSTIQLLHERVPKARATYSNATELTDIRTTANDQEIQLRVLKQPNPRTPEIQLLSNGRYHVMMTSAGGSYSRWNDIAVTRWREDSTRDNWGSFCYIRDIEKDHFWSTTFQPTLTEPDSYEVIFSEGRAEFRRSDNNFKLHTEIVVSPEDDIELRRTHITNRSRYPRTIEITSYAEVVMAPAAADAMHPAFSNLFIQTEIVEPHCAILCTRRPRSQEEKNPWMFHLMTVHGTQINEVSYETDRMKFIGRGHTVAAPQAMLERGALSNSQGSVLDPIVAIRYQITLDAEQTVSLDMVTGITDSRASCLELIDKYQDCHLADRVIELSWTHSQVMLRQLDANEADAQLYARLANSVVYVNPMLRAEAGVLIRNHRGQSALWSHAISGDLPIVLVQIKSQENIELVRQLVKAHAYWRSKGLAVDLAIWNEEHNGYRQELQEQIIGLISSVTGAHAIDKPGGIFVRIYDQISDEDRLLFQSVARAILSDSRGTLSEQVNRRDLIKERRNQIPSKIYPLKVQSNRTEQTEERRSFFPFNHSSTDELVSTPELAENRVPLLSPVNTVPKEIKSTGKKLPKQELILGNGIGGFTKDGREYIITTTSDQVTPAPWVNILANPQFGTVISESGQAYTWGENAHEFRLTPWANDPVSDLGGEVFYLRDEETGHYWSPTPLPCRGTGDYVTRHGFGYSVFEHNEDGLVSELTVFVALDATIKYSVLRVRNDSDRTRQLSSTGYVEWVLGDLRPKSVMHIHTEIDPTTNALFARNPYNTEFTRRTAFFDVDSDNRTYSGDRNEFIGRNRSLNNPSVMEKTHLSGKVGAGLDPCAAMQVQFELEQGQQKEIVFMLGVADTRHVNVGQLVQHYRGANAAQEALEKVREYWQHTLGAVQVETPDPTFNVLANGWLMYQTIACRMWARSGYYQSGGAFGFRDQLQDSMALVHSEPKLVREHLLLCAAHQFIEGDVQHWWHPPTDRGVRTNCSDDFLWLPLAVHRYVMSTGDSGVLDENAHFIEGRSLTQDEDSFYDLPSSSAESANLYEHCVKAIEHGLRFGVNGLSLIGSCDWNDGMDKVGHLGKGESIWLSFFLYDVLMRFAEISTMKNDLTFAKRCHHEARELQQNIESNGWDGEWYRRAYFDNGTPLGSAQNIECQIDSISQSWSVLSGAGDPARSKIAMQAMDRRLVKRDDAIIQLLDPPFDKSDQNPGYIRGYVPGVRENGGQYTHAAIWAAMAFAKMGTGGELADKERAWELMQMINPINHGKSAEDVERYKVEPYVIAADVYAVAPHVGRGGWTWYTGSSGWMYRLMTESLLGLHLMGDKLMIRPCLPLDWSTYQIHYRYRDTLYQISITQSQNADAVASVNVDGVEQPEGMITLIDDHETHTVRVLVKA
jgi:cyclic beta-1,2-glucan synthetase